MPKLTGKQVRHLRALGHKLKPIVLVGKEAVTERLVASCKEQLDVHELIKVKILESCPQDRKEVASELAQHTGASVAQVLGRTILLYLPSPAQLITLP
ncbi:RNA-binding protein [Syntrophotalea acetylenivorans]|uniref:RNA-binding protein n=1 Tax=Syntrophotalea acetylenivorans TaxID=1842532 RepID=A0A1L3GLI2_9BACT|nr:ribosome assembly RNA-binding protein YhbY [Syntrophotalea acetylenivorans]APG26774.1 RNA-binding protein [Syntrophotalea acetylenivorans]